jgi:hypothetical protein
MRCAEGSSTICATRSVARPAEIERCLRGRRPVVLHAIADGQRGCPVVVLLPQGRRPDRAIAEYCNEIWNVLPVTVKV